jgi:2-hydroxychromene-2-carboxylate isomerase
MKHVDLYFDYASPWAYLASETVARRLPGVTIAWKPIYLRGLETFSKGLPYTGAKLDYLIKDFTRCTAHEGVPVAPPAAFPLDGLHALRAAYVAMDAGAFDRFHRAMFRAIWAEQRDAGKETVAAILAEAVGPAVAKTADEALAKMSEPAVKERLREATAKAAERGVFGTPTFFVGDEMFWGCDRMDYVARAAAA